MLLMGQSTISMAIFNSKLLVYQSVMGTLLSMWQFPIAGKIRNTPEALMRRYPPGLGINHDKFP